MAGGIKSPPGNSFKGCRKYGEFESKERGMPTMDFVSKWDVFHATKQNWINLKPYLLQVQLNSLGH